MTEQELVDQMVALTTTARSILQNIQTYGTVDQDVTFEAGGLSITVQSVPKQVGQMTAAFDVMKEQFTGDFGGAVAGMTLTRDSAGRVTDVVTTLSSGWTVTHAYTRNAAGKVSAIEATIKDEVGATQATLNKTINYDASNRFASIS